MEEHKSLGRCGSLVNISGASVLPLEVTQQLLQKSPKCWGGSPGALGPCSSVFSPVLAPFMGQAA